MAGGSSSATVPSSAPDAMCAIAQSGPPSAPTLVGSRSRSAGSSGADASASTGDAPPFTARLESAMSLGTILLIVLILLLVGAFPSWPHSSGWGYGPSGALGLVVAVVVVLLVMGRL